MKEDKLEKFVRENRMDFDNLEPSMAIWDKINAPRSKKTNWLKIALSTAAAVLFLAGLYFIYDNIQNKKEQFAQQPKEKTKLQEKNQKEIPVIVNPEKKIAVLNNDFKKGINTNQKKSYKAEQDEVNELAEASNYYTNEIENKKEEILICVAYDPEIKSEINEEFSPLDAAFNELKKDLNDNADNSQVMEAMIQNYRTKLDLLNDIKNQLCSK